MEFATGALDVHPSRNFQPPAAFSPSNCAGGRRDWESRGATAHVAHALSFRYP